MSPSNNEIIEKIEVTKPDNKDHGFLPGIYEKLKYVTSRGERVPKSMEIQYSWANIKEDMSNFMKNSENFISNYFCV